MKLWQVSYGDKPAGILLTRPKNGTRTAEALLSVGPYAVWLPRSEAASLLRQTRMSITGRVRNATPGRGQ